MAGLRIVEEVPTPDSLAAFESVPIAFEVMSRLRVQPVEGGLGGLVLREEPVAEPYVKDYDLLEAERPANWSRHWDLTGWTLLLAWLDDELAGGAALAWRSEEFPFVRGQPDTLVLANIRVAPPHRRAGVGAALFQAAEAWGRVRECRRLAVETQDVNVAACRFYAAMGCTLGSIERFAYPALPDEARLIWYRDL